MKKALSIILAMLLLVTCFAACGQKSNVITVGYTIYEPMNYKDADGKLVGYDTELAEKVFSNLGYTVNFQEIIWDNRYTDLSSNVIDCIWNGFTCNSKDDDGVLRSEKVDFSYKYMENRQVVVVRKDAGITTADNLKKKLGVAESGSAGQEYAKAFAETTFKGFTKQTECLTEVLAKTADFAVVDAQLAKSYAGKGDYADLMIVEALSSDVEYYAIGFEKGSELTAKVNAELEKLAADGTIAALAEKYGVSNTAIKDFADQKK